MIFSHLDLRELRWQRDLRVLTPVSLTDFFGEVVIRIFCLNIFLLYNIHLSIVLVNTKGKNENNCSIGHLQFLQLFGPRFLMLCTRN